MKKGILFIAISILSIIVLSACQKSSVQTPLWALVFAPVIQSNSPTDTNNRIGVDYLWYGINQYSTEANLPTLAAYREDLKFNIVRFDIYWYFIEPTRGGFNWTRTDLIVSTLPSNVQLLFTVYCTAPWAIKGRRDAGNNLITSIMPSTAPVDYTNYYNFVHALAARYKGRVRYYQVENEVYGAQSFWMGTSNEYLNLLQTGYHAVKDADPAASVLPAGIAFETVDVTQPIAPSYQAAFNFIKLVYSSGKNYFDIADVHLYYTLESVPNRLQWLRALMSVNSYSKPVWVSEIGGLDSRAYADSADTAEQSIDLVKRYVLAFAGSVDKVFWLSVHKAKDAESPPWVYMTLTKDAAALNKNPAYHTLKLLISKIDNFTGVTAVTGGYKFTVAGETVLVLWKETSAIVDLSAYFSNSSVQITHIVTDASDSIPVVQTTASNAVQVGREPVFVEKGP